MTEQSRCRIERILARVRDVPTGSVATYGQIAQLAGLPGRARLVGHALRQLPAQTDVPWHRIVAAGGRLSLPPDSEPWREQRQRLGAEGVLVTGGRIALARFQWSPDIDELIWKPQGL